MYDRAGLSTKCTLIKIGFKNLRTSTEAKIRPFVDTLMCVSILRSPTRTKRTEIDTKTLKSDISVTQIEWERVLTIRS